MSKSFLLSRLPNDENETNITTSQFIYKLVCNRFIESDKKIYIQLCTIGLHIKKVVKVNN